MLKKSFNHIKSMRRMFYNSKSQIYINTTPNKLAKSDIIITNIQYMRLMSVNNSKFAEYYKLAEKSRNSVYM